MLEIPGRVAALVSVTEMIVQRLEQLESGQARLESGQARLESDVEGLKEGQARLEASVDRLESGQANLSSRFGNIIGSDYERRAAQSAGDWSGWAWKCAAPESSSPRPLRTGTRHRNF